MKTKRILALLFQILTLIAAFALPSIADAEEQYETFDGRVYNGKFYPRIDIIEWSEENQASHMEFQNYNKNVPVEMSFKLDDKNGRKIMLVRYYIKDRNEYLCRRVPAPAHFKKDFLVYLDEADSDRVITMVAAEPLPEKRGRKLVKFDPYISCDEEVKSKERMPAAAPKDAKMESKKPANDGSISKDGQDVPFSDL